MLHSVIILKTYWSLLFNHILHKFSITRHLFQSFYQRDNDAKLFQHSDKTSVVTILSILHQSLREWWCRSRNGDNFWGTYASFYVFSTNSSLASTTSVFFHLIFHYRRHRWIKILLTFSSSDCDAMSITFRILDGISRKSFRLAWVQSSKQLGNL